LYSNSVVSRRVAITTLNTSGKKSLAVTLRNLNGTAGINHFVAVVESADGGTGMTSQPVTVRYSP
jgi:hypothetical protein